MISIPPAHRERRDSDFRCPRSARAALLGIVAGMSIMFGCTTDPLAVVSVAISGPTTVEVGSTAQLTVSVTVTVGEVTQTVAWSSTDPSIATVTSQGMVIGIGSGSVDIIATSVDDPTAFATHSVTVPEITVVLSQATASLEAGATLQLVATVVGTLNTGVSWTSSEPLVAAVSGDGFVTALRPGTTEVTATSRADPARSASATITVEPVTVSVAPPAASIDVGATVQLTPVVAGAVDSRVIWTSGAGKVASVDDAGLVTGLATGVATITATSVADPSVSGSATVTVAGVDVIVTPGAASLRVGEQQQLAAVVTGAANAAVTWTSSAGAVASVDGDGLVTGVTSGTAVITARSVADPTKSASSTITVSSVGISVTPSQLSLLVGQQQQLTAVVTGVVDQGVSWTSSAGAVASVDENGLVTGVTSGTATITARSVAEPSRSASATVTVVAVGVSVSPGQVGLTVGGSQQLTATVSGTADQRVTWSSDATHVADVDATGLVTAVGAGTATITATSVVDPSRSASSAITVTAPLTLVTSALSQAWASFAYQLALVASGGTGAYTFTITQGSLPPGLQMSTTGLIDGTPTALGPFNFTARVTSGAESVTRAFTLVVNRTWKGTLAMESWGGGLVMVRLGPSGRESFSVNPTTGLGQKLYELPGFEAMTMIGSQLVTVAQGQLRSSFLPSESHPTRGIQNLSGTVIMAGSGSSVFVVQSGAMRKLDTVLGTLTATFSNAWSNTDGLAVTDDRLYVVRNGELLEVDMGTGARTRISGFDEWLDTEAVTAGDPGRLFIVRDGVLHDVDAVTGASTALGADDWSGVQAMTHTTGLGLFIVQGDILYEVDTTTGAGTAIR